MIRTLENRDWRRVDSLDKKRQGIKETGGTVANNVSNFKNRNLYLCQFCYTQPGVGSRDPGQSPEQSIIGWKPKKFLKPTPTTNIG